MAIDNPRCFCESGCRDRMLYDPPCFMNQRADRESCVSNVDVPCFLSPSESRTDFNRGDDRHKQSVVFAAAEQSDHLPGPCLRYEELHVGTGIKEPKSQKFPRSRSKVAEAGSPRMGIGWKRGGTPGVGTERFRLIVVVGNCGAFGL